MLGCWAGHLLATRGKRSCADGTVRASGAISPFKALGSAGNKTMRSGETCERRLPVQHPQEEARPSKTQRYDEGYLLDSPYLNGLEDLLLAMSGVHDHRPIWNFTYQRVANAAQEAAAETGLGTVTLHQVRHSGASVDMAATTSDVGCCSEERNLLGGEMHAQVLTLQTTENSLQKSEHYAKNAKKTPSTNHAGVASSCAIEHGKNQCCCAKRSLRRLQRLSATWKLRAIRWNPYGRYFADLFAGGKEVARAVQAHGFRAQSWDTIFDATHVNLCQSAVRARLKHDIKVGRVLVFCLTPPSGAALVRAQRAALCLFSFSSTYCDKRPHVRLSCILSAPLM